MLGANRLRDEGVYCTARVTCVDASTPRSSDRDRTPRPPPRSAMAAMAAGAGVAPTLARGGIHHRRSGSSGGSTRTCGAAAGAAAAAGAGAAARAGGTAGGAEHVRGSRSVTMRAGLGVGRRANHRKQSGAAGYRVGERVGLADIACHVIYTHLEPSFLELNGNL